MIEIQSSKLKTQNQKLNEIQKLNKILMSKLKCQMNVK